MLTGLGPSQKSRMLRASGPLPPSIISTATRWPFQKIGEAAAIERRGVHENVFATAVPNDKSKPLIGVVPLHRTDLLDGGLIGGPVGSLGARAPRRLLERGAGINTEDLGHLLALLARPDPSLKRGARGHRTLAAAFKHARVEKGIAAGWELYEAEAFFGVVPLHRD